nr:DUF2182 domain-containing protein [Chelatococcus sp. YT9]
MCLSPAERAFGLTADRARDDAMACGHGRQRVVSSVAALVFVASTAATILGCASMETMDGMPMPGDWSMSLAWLPMCGQTWSDAALSFLGMWTVMMVAMMLPSLMPILWRYHRGSSLSRAGQPGLLTLLVGAAYFLVWALLGMLVFVIGSQLATLAMRRPDLAQTTPMLMGAWLLLAGVFQCTPSKARLLACCRSAPEGGGQWANGFAASAYGLRLGLICCLSCSALVAVLLVLGVMDLRAMLLVTAAITAERLAPRSLRVPEAIGTVTAGAGGLLIAQAAGLT